MSEEFKLDIVNPEKLFVSKNDVLEVVAPSLEGEMGILKNHISIISFLKPGILKVISKNIEENYFIEDGEAFGPNEIFWEYQDGSFYANKQSGAFRLENGNTLIIDSDSALIFEVSIDGDVVWEYQGSGSQINRAQKYSVNYLSIAGDVNSDNIINILDVVQLVNFILNGGSYNSIFDINIDSQINILDVVSIINIILS